MGIANSLPSKTLLSGTSNLGATVNSTALNVSGELGYAIQITTANQASLNVSATLAYSVDGVNYVSDSSVAQTITTNTSYVWNIANVYYNYVRVQITRTAGNADCTIVASSKA